MGERKQKIPILESFGFQKGIYQGRKNKSLDVQNDWNILCNSLVLLDLQDISICIS